LKIYHKKDNKLFCYRFHDVITKFSKIKLQIATFNSKANENNKKKDEDLIEISFDISPQIMKEIKDYIVPYP